MNPRIRCAIFSSIPLYSNEVNGAFNIFYLEPFDFVSKDLSLLLLSFLQIFEENQFKKKIRFSSPRISEGEFKNVFQPSVFNFLEREKQNTRKLRFHNPLKAAPVILTFN